jgi:hypothetical protein
VDSLPCSSLVFVLLASSLLLPSWLVRLLFAVDQRRARTPLARALRELTQENRAAGRGEKIHEQKNIGVLRARVVVR